VYKPISVQDVQFAIIDIYISNGEFGVQYFYGVVCRASVKFRVILHVGLFLFLLTSGGTLVFRGIPVEKHCWGYR